MGVGAGMGMGMGMGVGIVHTRRRKVKCRQDVPLNLGEAASQVDSGLLRHRY